MDEDYADSGNDQGGFDEGQGSNDYSLAGDFLGRVPEEHRSVIEPYVKQWDAGVTRRFQELHQQYRPYADLGADPDTLRQAHTVYQRFVEDPRSVYEMLHSEFGQQAQGYEGDDESGSEQDFSLPPEFQQKLEKQERVLEAVADYILQQRQAETAQQQDSELDEYVNLLKTEFGEFDEDYVLTKMLAGMDGAEAVKSYQNLVQQRINEANQALASAPPVLGGGGAVPSDNSTVQALSRKDTRSLVEGVLGTLRNQ